MGRKFLPMLRFLFYLIFFVCTTIACSSSEPNRRNISFTIGKWNSLVGVSLSSWEIGLNTSLISNQRNLGDARYSASPPNWIAFVNPNGGCRNTVGVSANDCLPFDTTSVGTTVGLCYTRTYTNGNNIGTIVDSTSIMNTKVLLTLNRDLQLNIITHETGHCLGLQHWTGVDGSLEGVNNGQGYEPDPPNSGCYYTPSLSSPDCTEATGSRHNPNRHIMHPYVSGSPKPQLEELGAIKAVYENCSRNNRIDCIAPQDAYMINSVGNTISTIGIVNNCTTSINKKTTILYDDYSANTPCYYTQLTDPTKRVYQRTFPEFYLNFGNNEADQRATIKTDTDEILEPTTPPPERKLLEGEVVKHEYRIILTPKGELKEEKRIIY